MSSGPLSPPHERLGRLRVKEFGREGTAGAAETTVAVLGMMAMVDGSDTIMGLTASNGTEMDMVPMAMTDIEGRPRTVEVGATAVIIGIPEVAAGVATSGLRGTSSRVCRGPRNASVGATGLNVEDGGGGGLAAAVRTPAATYRVRTPLVSTCPCRRLRW